MIKRDHRITALAIALHRRSVDGNDVELAIVVAVDQTHPAAHGFGDVLLIGRRNVRDDKAGLLCDIFKLREGDLCALLLGLWYRHRRLRTSGLYKQQRG